MSVITLKVQPRGRPLKRLPESIEIDSNTTTEQLHTILAAKCNISVHRLRITKGSDGSAIRSKDHNDDAILVTDTGLRDNSHIFVKDLGPQIGWRTVFVIEYIGPIIIHPLFLYVLRPFLYKSSPYNPLGYLPFIRTYSGAPPPPPTSSQILCCALIALHFLKREYETLFVHRFSASTMPFNFVFRNSAHYWLLAGVTYAASFYAPREADPSWLSNPFILYGAIAFWLWAEVSNFITHVTLRNLRPADGSTKRQIPRGYGFDLVACPNYLFESLGWVAVTVLTGFDLMAIVFLVVGSTVMALWAKGKSKRYKKEFGKEYKLKYYMYPGIW